MDISRLLKFAIEKNASDMLLTAGSPPVYRIDGELVYTNTRPLSSESCKSLVYGILDEEQIARFEARKELDFSFYLEGTHRFRGNVYMQRGSIGAAFRLIPERIPSLEELALPPIIEEFALTPMGLVLITGPTGHGKSTTQACMIDIINTKKRVHIITIEDPIEFVHKNRRCVIDQREVGYDTMSFAEALKHVLRQDPDVILVGEMRDLETIATALTAAETGHLVIATLHTNDAVQTINRLIDVFPAHQQGQIKAQLSLCLLAVVSQRLLPRADGKGRIVATEVMRNNPAVAHLIRDGKIEGIYSVMETHAKEGMFVMDTSIKNLYMQGIITFEEAKLRMRNPQVLEAL
jgi:twitching motility protein PilT